MNMRGPRLRVILVALSLSSAPRLSSAQPAQQLPYRDPHVAIGDRVRDVLASVARPVIELKGFQRVHLEPGEERVVSFTLARDQLQMLDRNLPWVVEPGLFRVLIGGSSKDIRLRGDLTVR
jgi:hypothetical protein